jgi:FAD binding domain
LSHECREDARQLRRRRARLGCRGEDGIAYLSSFSDALIDPALAETLVRTGPEMVEYLEADIRSCGLALIGALLRGCLDHGVDAETGVRAQELIVTDGRVTGVEVEIEGEPRDRSPIRRRPGDGGL